MNKIYFTADLHFGHTNILKHQPNRLFAGENDSTKHDEWLLELWRNTVGKKDMIYILGDLTFLKSEGARLLLENYPAANTWLWAITMVPSRLIVSTSCVLRI